MKKTHDDQWWDTYRKMMGILTVDEAVEKIEQQKQELEQIKTKAKQAEDAYEKFKQEREEFYEEAKRKELEYRLLHPKEEDVS